MRKSVHEPVACTRWSPTLWKRRAVDPPRPAIPCGIPIEYQHLKPVRCLIMQSLPEARSQSYEELYGPPENFLEIEVSFLTPLKTLGLNLSGAQSNDAWNGPWHVHNLRNRHADEHPRFQAEVLLCSSQILGIWGFSWHSGTRVCTRHYSTTPRQSPHP